MIVMVRVGKWSNRKRGRVKIIPFSGRTQTNAEDRVIKSKLSRNMANKKEVLDALGDKPNPYARAGLLMRKRPEITPETPKRVADAIERQNKAGEIVRDRKRRASRIMQERALNQGRLG